MLITKFNNFKLNENNNYSNKTIVCVDIQPEYENYISFNLDEWSQFINEQYENNNIVFLYNGTSLGMIEEYDYKDWLIDLGINEDIIDNSEFIDKSYGFFRNAMDSNIDQDDIIKILKFMKSEDINDSREITEEQWNTLDIEYARDKMESDDADVTINIPDVIDNLENYDNIVLCGGGETKCLLEIEIALNVIDKEYQTIRKFIY
jgi:hypothetical protein